VNIWLRNEEFKKQGGNAVTNEKGSKERKTRRQNKSARQYVGMRRKFPD
jgi:hypothetical protein